MKKAVALFLTLLLLLSASSFALAEDITLDVIICQYGPNTSDWFTGTGMDGTSFVKKFEEANPGISSIWRSSPGTMCTPSFPPASPTAIRPTSSTSTYLPTMPPRGCSCP